MLIIITWLPRWQELSQTTLAQPDQFHWHLWMRSAKIWIKNWVNCGNCKRKWQSSPLIGREMTKKKMSSPRWLPRADRKPLLPYAVRVKSEHWTLGCAFSWDTCRFSTSYARYTKNDNSSMILECSWFVIEAFEWLKAAEKNSKITYRINTQSLPLEEWRSLQSFSGQKQ